MIIYVVYHSQLEDTNVFFTDKNKALEKIKELVVITETKIEEWGIREFKEGEYFVADISSF